MSFREGRRDTTADVSRPGRLGLIAVAIAVAVGAAALARRGCGDPEEGSAEAPTLGPAAPAPARVGRERRPTTASPVRGGDDEVRTYVTERGAAIRDHRSHPEADPVLLPAPMPPEQRTMSSAVTAALLREVRPAVVACGRDVPDRDRGESPTVMVTLKVDITDGVLTVSEADVAPIHIAAASGDVLRACVRDRVGTITTPTPDEPDRTRYVTRFPIRLR